VTLFRLNVIAEANTVILI